MLWPCFAVAACKYLAASCSFITFSHIRLLPLAILRNAPGDGIVTSRSLEAIAAPQATGVESILKSSPGKFICEDHNKLAGNAKIQDYIIGVLDNTKVKTVADSDKVHFEE